jgi:hypothetical protein
MTHNISTPNPDLNRSLADRRLGHHLPRQDFMPTRSMKQHGHQRRRTRHDHHSLSFSNQLRSDDGATPRYDKLALDFYRGNACFDNDDTPSRCEVVTYQRIASRPCCRQIHARAAHVPLGLLQPPIG